MLFVTEFQAVNEYTGEIETYEGQYVEALTWEDAISQCRKHAPYLEVVGILEAEVPCDDDYNADFDNEIRYDNSN
jgi:hypothetical protein